MLKPNGGDIVMGILLFVFAITMAVIFLAAPETLVADKPYYRSCIVFTLADLAVAFAVLCKGLFYRWFKGQRALKETECTRLRCILRR